MEQANTHKRLIREHLLNGGTITALEALRAVWLLPPRLTNKRPPIGGDANQKDNGGEYQHGYRQASEICPIFP